MKVVQQAVGPSNQGHRNFQEVLEEVQQNEHPNHGQIPELLGGLAEMGYDGCITMEPHLQVGGQFGGSTSPEQYATAISAVRQLAKEVGLELE